MTLIISGISIDRVLPESDQSSESESIFTPDHRMRAMR
jgi:hypothetical protein